MTDTNDYLWDQQEPVVRDVEALEQTLGTLRYNRTADDLPFVSPRSPWARPLAIAAALAVVGTIGWFTFGGSARPAWRITDTTGSPQVAGAGTVEPGVLRRGQNLNTGGQGTARLHVADIGTLHLQPSTSVTLLDSSRDGHRVQLEHGTIVAEIEAPPRLFLIDTPSAQAVDLGCAYQLESDELGEGQLHVTWGWVALERGNSASTVPEGATCRLRAGQGPGLPCFLDATPAFRAAVTDFDNDETDAIALQVMLQEARFLDTLTLHHLIDRTTGTEFAQVVDRMTQLSPLPQGVTRQQILDQDDRAIGAWWKELSVRWLPEG